MRVLLPEALAELAGSKPIIVLLVEMDLTEPLYLNSSSLDLTFNGVTYYGTEGLGRVGAVKQTPAELPQLQFELSGVPSEMISLALSEPVQGKAARIKTAILSSSTGALLHTDIFWQGALDVMTITDGDPTATISVTAETAGIDFSRTASSPYTNDEQQRLHPGDLSLQFINDQVEQKIIWPAAVFFRQ